MKVILTRQLYENLVLHGYKKYGFGTGKTDYRDEILIHAKINKTGMERFRYPNLNYSIGCITHKSNLVVCVCVNLKLVKKRKL